MIPTPENAPPGTEVIYVSDVPRNPMFTGELPQKNTIYTIRAHVLSRPHEIPALLLEEIVNGPSLWGDEWCHPAQAFRLLHPLTNADHDFWKAPYPVALETL